MTTDELGDLAPLASELAQALAPAIQLGGLLGRGGMGAVFLGRDPALKRSVVIKVLAPDLAHDETARKRFAREAESAAAVAHPNVVAVHLVGELPRSKTAYFVMQHVDGVTLGEACPESVKVPAARVRRIVGEVASALAAAHARGLVHRDIKPANVMLEKDTERAIVLDFGISAALTRRGDGSADTRLTQQGTSLGTPRYMSPEQAAGDDVTGQSDVYSLGVVAFELLAGRAPFEATSPMALAAAHIKDAPPDLMTLRPDLDSSFAALIERMLAKQPAERPEASEVSRALLPSAHAVIEWPPPGLERVQGSLALGLRWLTGTMLGLLAFLAVLLFQPAGMSMPFMLLVALVGFSVLIVVMGAAIGISQADNRILWARQSGYPAGVALDVGLDRCPDTGEMLNAAGRYASLDARGARSEGGGWKLLRRRRWAALGLAAGMTLSLVLFFGWASGVLGLPNDTTATIALREVLALLLPAGLGQLAWWALMARERRLRRLVRPRETALAWLRSPPVPAELVGGWLATSGIAAPPPRGKWRLRILANAYELPIALALMMPMLAVLAVMVSAVFLPRPVRDERGWRLWQQEVTDAVERGGGFRGLDSLLGRSAPAGVVVDTAAVRAFLAANDRVAGSANPGQVRQAFAELPGRLPDSLRQGLAAMAAGDSAALFGRVARSAPLPALWYAGNRRMHADSIAVLLRPLNAMSRASLRRAASAALALERGDKAAAVAAARQVLGMGRQLWRDPVRQTTNSGLGMLDLGVEVLRAIALATGDRRLGREADSLLALIQARRVQAALFTSQRFESYVALPSDTVALHLAGWRELAPVDRWNAMTAISHGACWNTVEIRRGVSPRRREALAEAARRAADIAHTDEWAALLNGELDQLDTVNPGGRGEPLPWTLRWFKPAMRATMCSGGRVPN
jgi:tRNA A-37 threonylcarbamoyl transferase component Bud32